MSSGDLYVAQPLEEDNRKNRSQRRKDAAQAQITYRSGIDVFTGLANVLESSKSAVVIAVVIIAFYRDNVKEQLRNVFLKDQREK